MGMTYRPWTNQCSPRRRGWTEHQQRPEHHGAGVPRAGGDGPTAYMSMYGERLCSPRRRGWTDRRARRGSVAVVFPAQAGMDRRPARAPRTGSRVPRAGRDGPSCVCGCQPFASCSPRRRGWTGQGVRGRHAPRVFPAQAGMNRCRPAPRPCRLVLLLHRTTAAITPPPDAAPAPRPAATPGSTRR